MTATHLDWGRELCRQGCREWVPWYRNKKGKIVNGCRLGMIPQKVNGQWYCRQLKSKGRLSRGVAG